MGCRLFFDIFFFGHNVCRLRLQAGASPANSQTRLAKLLLQNYNQVQQFSEGNRHIKPRLFS